MMTEEQKKIVVQALNTIVNEDIREFATVLLEGLPDYIWHVGASSTGKYHPKYSLGDAGLMRHQVAVVRFLNYFFELEQYNTKLTSREMDLMRVAGLVHDGRKSGEQADYEKSKYTKFNHPEIMANVIRSYDDKYLSHEEIEFVADIISRHMGQWNVDSKTGVELPKPNNKYSRMLHLADYLASRKDLTMSFDDVPQAEEKPVSVDDYVFTFGKHKGEKITDVYKEHPDYLDWMAQNIHKKEVLDMIKILKERDKNKQN